MWMANHFRTDHDDEDHVSEGGNKGDMINFDGGNSVKNYYSLFDDQPSKEWWTSELWGWGWSWFGCSDDEDDNLVLTAISTVNGAALWPIVRSGLNTTQLVKLMPIMAEIIQIQSWCQWCQKW